MSDIVGKFVKNSLGTGFEYLAPTVYLHIGRGNLKVWQTAEEITRLSAQGSNVHVIDYSRGREISYIRAYDESTLFTPEQANYIRQMKPRLNISILD